MQEQQNRIAETRVCRRCLTKEMPDAQYYKNMYDYINNLDEEVKTPEDTYRKRLAACKECGDLLNGLCRICGCFVEMRAAVNKNYCPAIHPKW